MTSTAVGSSSLALPVLDADLEARLRARLAEVEERAASGDVQQRGAVRHRGRPAPAARRRQAVPAAAGAAGRRVRRPDARRACVTAACVVELTHLGLALPRRRDGRGRPAPRRRVGQRPLGQPRRDPHRRLPVLQVLGADRRARRRRRAHPGARRSPGSSRARSSRPSTPGPGEDPLAHYLRGRRGQDRLADRHLGPLRRPVRRRAAGGRGGAHGVRREGRHRPSSSPTTSSTSPRDSDESGKTPGTDLREGVPTLPVLMAQRVHRPRRRPAARAARRRPHRRRPARRGARPAAQAPGDGRGAAPTCSASPREAQELLEVLPEGPVRDALDAFAVLIATRTA